VRSPGHAGLIRTIIGGAQIIDLVRGCARTCAIATCAPVGVSRRPPTDPLRAPPPQMILVIDAVKGIQTQTAEVGRVLLPVARVVRLCFFPWGGPSGDCVVTRPYPVLRQCCCRCRWFLCLLLVAVNATSASTTAMAAVRPAAFTAVGTWHLRSAS
jgi:hypothetical protein